MSTVVVVVVHQQLRGHIPSNFVIHQSSMPIITIIPLHLPFFRTKFMIYNRRNSFTQVKSDFLWSWSVNLNHPSLIQWYCWILRNYVIIITQRSQDDDKIPIKISSVLINIWVLKKSIQDVDNGTPTPNVHASWKH